MVQVRELRMDWRQAAGPCVARALAQTLWAGEGHYLQVRARLACRTNKCVGMSVRSTG